jgi:hypothetical protein
MYQYTKDTERDVHLTTWTQVWEPSTPPFDASPDVPVCHARTF